MFQDPGSSKVDAQLKQHLEWMEKNPNTVLWLRRPTHENEIKETLAKCSAFINGFQKNRSIH